MVARACFSPGRWHAVRSLRGHHSVTAFTGCNAWGLLFVLLKRVSKRFSRVFSGRRTTRDKRSSRVRIGSHNWRLRSSRVKTRNIRLKQSWLKLRKHDDDRAAMVIILVIEGRGALRRVNLLFGLLPTRFSTLHVRAQFCRSSAVPRDRRFDTLKQASGPSSSTESGRSRGVIVKP